MISLIKKVLLTSIFIIFTTNAAAEQIISILGSSANPGFPLQIGLYDSPAEFVYTIVNNSDIDIPEMRYSIPSYFNIDNANSNCGAVLNRGSSCTLAFRFIPNNLGQFSDELVVCGGGDLWCSKVPSQLAVTVTQNYIVSTNCNDIEPRPFGDLTCNSSWQYAENFRQFMSKVLNADPVHREFNYYQHKLSVDETATPCLEARQIGVGLDSNILGGGDELCTLMGYANTNASPSTSPSTDTKQFPPYIDFLLGTKYPVTTPLNMLANLLQDFNTSAMNSMVRNVGYTGYVNFLISYLQSQVSKTYQNCGGAETCPTISYLPYKISDALNVLQNWPIPNVNFWGISGGGGSGAGVQVLAFMPGSERHYTLYSAGGGGGGGNSNPEISNALNYLINVGSGGGGGNQFANCYIKKGQNLNGLGLGAGTGSGLSILEGSSFSFQVPPAVEYSFSAPTNFPDWDNATILSEYGSNLQYLFNTQIPALYALGYTIQTSGGGGGGSGLEFLNPNMVEFTPHALSIGHGFNFCTAYNINGDFRGTDCIPSPTITPATTTINHLIYQNIGPLFRQCMKEAILPKNCDGFQHSVCVCNYQHACVISNLGTILEKSNFSVDDIPSWLNNSHCNHNQSALALQAKKMPTEQRKVLHKYLRNQQSATCDPPWN